MRMIGKIDELPLFEYDDGMYIAVDKENGRCVPMWCWYANLGRWFDSFEKCEYSEDEDECIEIIQENIDMIVEAFNSYSDELKSEMGKEFLSEQDRFYEWLESGREYIWQEGYVDGGFDEIEEEVP